MNVICFDQVRASDNGTDKRRSQQKIRISVNPAGDKDGEPPRFGEKGLREHITENDQPGQLIKLLTADDKDSRNTLIFAIEGRSFGQVFSLMNE